MRRTALLLLFGLCALAACGQTSARISSYHSDLTVNDDGSLSVCENITVQPSTTQPVDGLYRNIPTAFSLGNGLQHRAPVTAVDAACDGQPIPAQLQPERNITVIELGGPNRQLAATPHTFTLRYATIHRFVTEGSSDVLRWSVTGKGWNMPISDVVATVALPAGITPSQVTLTGQVRGQTALTAGVDPKTQLLTLGSTSLVNHENLLLELRLPHGLLHRPASEGTWAQLFEDNFALLLGLIGLVLTTLVYGIIQLLIGRDPEKGVIKPQCIPPHALSPGMLRYVWKMRYDTKILAAILVSLATKGLIHINELEDRYVLGLKRENPGDSVKSRTAALRATGIFFTPDEEVAARMLLGKKGSFTFAYEQAATLTSTIKAVTEILEQGGQHTYFEINALFIRIGTAVSLLLLSLAAFRDIPSVYPLDQLRVIAGIAVLGWAMPAMITYGFHLWQDMFDTHVGRIGNTGVIVRYLLKGVVVLVIGIFLLWIASPTIWWLLIANIAVNGLFAHLLKAPTLRGRKLLDDIEGFRMYLSGEHPAMVSLINPPPKTVELYETLLPYALALDLAREWGAQFEDTFKQFRAGGGTALDWYSGDAWTGMHPRKFGISLDEELTPSMTPLTIPVDSTYDFAHE